MAVSSMQDTHPHQYKYNTLPPDRYVRYLVLDPGNCDQPLEGRLATGHIDSLPPFHAISYVWGSPDRVDQIRCEGRIVRITASLRDVLKRVRLSDHAVNIWADQICINQNDVAERNHQVALMSKIYAKS